MISQSLQGVHEQLMSIALPFLGLGSRKDAFVISLPPPVYLAWYRLLTLHVLLWWVDYLVVRYVSKSKVIKGMLAVIHFAMPLVFACPEFYINASMICGPWVVAAEVVHYAEQRLPFPSLTHISLHQIFAFQIDDKAPVDAYVRVRGIAKIARGVFKWSLMKAVVDPLLEPVHVGPEILDLPYFGHQSLWITVLLGIKVYFLLAVVDIVMGGQQFILGLPMMDLFDSPLLATGPRDFWGRRWNRPVHKILHQHFFPTDTLRSQYALRGFVCFLTSGVFHEVILAAVVRKMSLDQLVFFLIQGTAVFAQVKMMKGSARGGSRRQVFSRTARVVAHFLFITLTGRLFLAPYLRSHLSERFFR